MVKNRLKEEDVLNSLEWRLLKRSLKDEFDFVKNVMLASTDLNEYNCVFIDIYVDPFKMAEEYNLLPSTHLIYGSILAKETNRPMKSPFGSSFFDVPGDPKASPYQTLKPFNNDVEDHIAQLRKTEVIPNQYKLPKDRPFCVSQIVFDPSVEIPDDLLIDYVNNGNEWMIPKLSNRQQKLFTREGGQDVDNYTP